MNLRSLRGILAVALAVGVSVASAADELVLYAFEDGSAATGLEVVLDGEQSKILDASGSATFDLDAGRHGVAVLLGGVEVHRFNFTSAAGQLVDITVSLQSGEEPQQFVESYFVTETARDRASAPRGTLNGRIRNDGQSLAGATVSVPKVSETVQTQDDGSFTLELPRGVYDLQISHPSLSTPKTESVRVVSGITLQGRYQYGSTAASSNIEEVVVLGTFNPSAFGESERYSVNVIETLGIEQLARFGDTDVAASVVRVPSVTVQSSRFVFIRGLGGRYITTTLNGATLPSTDPTKREVPLDLFPSNIVKQLDVKKSFIASMPGESTGGNLVINTRTFPDEAAGKFSFSLGYTDGLTGDEVAFDPISGDYDAFGFDDGSRDVPGGVEAISALLNCVECEGSFSDGTRQALNQVAAVQLMNDLDLGSATAAPKVSLGANYGNLFTVGGHEVGFFAAANYRNDWDQKAEGVSRSYNTDGGVFDDFTFEEASNTIDTSGLLSLGMNVGDSSFQSTSVVSRSTEAATRVSQGRDGDSGSESYRYSIEWEERQFLSQQFSGEHVLGQNSGLVASWQITGSNARRYAPDRREVRFDLEGGDGVYDLIVPELVRRYDDLSDDNLDASTDWEYLFDNSLGAASFESGIQLIHRERDSDSQAFGYIGNESQYDQNSPNLLVSDVITLDNITGDQSTGLAFADRTLPSDSYEAELDLNSVYGLFTQRFADVYQVILGVRYEAYEQTTETFSIQGDGSAVLSSIDEDILLPSLALNWEIGDSQQLRFAASRTVSRPDFKETSNATFYDNQFNFRVRGNPALKVSEVTNLDLRWELYGDEDESLSVAAFYKTIEDPIERVLLQASGTAGNSRTFQNGEEADIYGIEFDGRRDFDINEGGSRSIFVALNASLIESEIELDGGQTRKLQGQPDYTFNLAVGYDDYAGAIRHELTMLINQSGETIVDVGLSDLPDVVEEPRFDLDLNYKAFITESLVFKAKAGNLLDETVEFTQGGQVFQEYKQGVTLEAGIDWNF
ncbi:TonB-dependent receptor [uncultured Abyssibacter sp.]|uniref:TonB-dependent receptor n=1 Tax=uncultured Abyssibacter sp. TaxID=2320202 RepID=UPI0032B17D58